MRGRDGRLAVAPFADAVCARLGEKQRPFPGQVQLEKLMDGWMEAQGPLEEFILPGGAPASAQLHVARCHVRRAEQLVMALQRTEPINLATIRYLNRLSDALFVMAREVNRRAGVKDVTWKPARKGP